MVVVVDTKPERRAEMEMFLSARELRPGPEQRQPFLQWLLWRFMSYYIRHCEDSQPELSEKLA